MSGVRGEGREGWGRRGDDEGVEGVGKGEVGGVGVWRGTGRGSELG